MTNSIIIDGMLSGTGVRDAIAGGYLNAEEIGISAGLRQRLTNWLLAYEDAHYHQFENDDVNRRLDEEGVSIAKSIAVELPDFVVAYFSNARLRKIDL